MVLETSGESFGVPTPAGSVLPSSDNRSEIPCRATCTSTPSAKVMVTTDRPGIDSERSVASPAAPLTAFSTCLVTSSSTCCGAKPGASVWMSTCDGTNSGKHVERRLHRAPGAEHQRQHRQRGDRAEVAHAQRDQRSHHGLFRCRAGIDFAGQQLARGHGYDLRTRIDAFLDEVSLRDGAARIEFSAHELAGLLLDITPIFPSVMIAAEAGTKTPASASPTGSHASRCSPSTNPVAFK